MDNIRYVDIKSVDKQIAILIPSFLILELKNTGNKVVPKIVANSKVSGLAFNANKQDKTRIKNLVINK